MQPNTTVNIKGIKFQSYKAIYNLIKKCVENEEPSMYFAIERFDDDSLIDIDNGASSIGQGKYYASDFSINSDEVKKCLKHFFNYYIRFVEDKEMSFEFYTCAGYKSENSTDIITKEELQILRDDNKVFLQILECKEFEGYEHVIKNVVGRILSPKEPEREKDNIIPFLKRINWNFGMGQLEEIRADAIALIKELPYYNHNFLGKEEFIFSYLVEKIEALALGKNSLTNFLSYKDIKDVFRDLKENNYKVYDDAQKEFSEVKKVNNRNLKTKILDVCSINDEKYFQLFERNIARAMTDHRRILPDKSATYLYRVYEKCDEVLYELAQQKVVYNREIINDILKKLYDESRRHLDDRRKDFLYQFESDDVLKNSILLLFNECYLDFSKED